MEIYSDKLMQPMASQVAEGELLVVALPLLS